jgi:hypothetical protein
MNNINYNTQDTMTRYHLIVDIFKAKTEDCKCYKRNLLEEFLIMKGLKSVMRQCPECPPGKLCPITIAEPQRVYGVIDCRKVIRDCPEDGGRFIFPEMKNVADFNNFWKKVEDFITL